MRWGVLFVVIVLMVTISFAKYFVVDYVVQKGDSICSISQDFGISPSTLTDWNPDITKKPLVPGQILRIPQPEGYIYEVKEKDTLSSIAKRFFTTVEDIMIANDMKSTIIYPGEKIFVPLSIIGKAFNNERMFLWPIYGEISSPYGWRVHPITKRLSFHTGLDIAAPEGTPIFAAESGIVTFAGRKGGYGLLIIVKSGKYQILYGHLSKICVYNGQFVKKGQLIGRVGNTGLSTGPHLHFEVRIDGKHTNPVAYLPSSRKMYVLKKDQYGVGGK